MTDKTRKSRRRLLKTIAAGGGVIATGKMLPDKWTSPLVDSVLLPAHAETTCCDIAGTYCYSDEGGLIVIVVEADGTVITRWTPEGSENTTEVQTSVSCSGGSFNVPNQGDGNDPMSGTIVCGQNSISDFEFDGDSLPVTKDACN